jgi:hypothetical protein
VKKKSFPYASATAGARARDEVIKILRRLGCEQIGFMDDFAKAEVTLAFVHRDRHFQMRFPGQGWARKFLAENPWGYSHTTPRQEYEAQALCQGAVAANSALRDWAKSQVTMIECGLVSFDAVFVPYMLTNDGRTLAERLPETKLLPEPAPPKVVASNEWARFHDH